jgi:ArsR family transcriptional regulator, arsenate/arsenite/antimonite-responsive transcriptional repressor
MRGLTKILKILSDETKLRVLNLIQERECCVCEVMQAMDISQSKASRALSALYDIGLLKLRREGRWAIYSIDDEQEKDYIRGILGAVRLYMTDNRIALGDMERLKVAKRIGPACVSANCKQSTVKVKKMQNKTVPLETSGI